LMGRNPALKPVKDRLLVETSAVKAVTAPRNLGETSATDRGIASGSGDALFDLLALTANLAAPGKIAKAGASGANSTNSAPEMAHSAATGTTAPEPASADLLPNAAASLSDDGPISVDALVAMDQTARQGLAIKPFVKKPTPEWSLAVLTSQAATAKAGKNAMAEPAKSDLPDATAPATAVAATTVTKAGTSADDATVTPTEPNAATNDQVRPADDPSVALATASFPTRTDAPLAESPALSPAPEKTTGTIAPEAAPKHAAVPDSALPDLAAPSSASEMPLAKPDLVDAASSSDQSPPTQTVAPEPHNLALPELTPTILATATPSPLPIDPIGPIDALAAEPILPAKAASLPNPKLQADCGVEGGLAPDGSSKIVLPLLSSSNGIVGDPLATAALNNPAINPLGNGMAPADIAPDPFLTSKDMASVVAPASLAMVKADQPNTPSEAVNGASAANTPTVPLALQPASAASGFPFIGAEALALADAMPTVPSSPLSSPTAKKHHEAALGTDGQAQTGSAPLADSTVPLSAALLPFQPASASPMPSGEGTKAEDTVENTVEKPAGKGREARFGLFRADPSEAPTAQASKSASFSVGPNGGTTDAAPDHQAAQAPDQGVSHPSVSDQNSPTVPAGPSGENFADPTGMTVSPSPLAAPGTSGAEATLAAAATADPLASGDFSASGALSFALGGEFNENFHKSSTDTPNMHQNLSQNEDLDLSMAVSSGKVSVESLMIRSHRSDNDTTGNDTTGKNTTGTSRDQDTASGAEPIQLAVFNDQDTTPLQAGSSPTQGTSPSLQSSTPVTNAEMARQTQVRTDNPVFLAQRDKAMQQQIIAALRAGKDEIRLSLYPPQLGQVTINMALDGQKVKLGLKTANREATHVLMDERQTLATALGHEGFTLDGFDVTDEQQKDRSSAREPDPIGTVPPSTAADSSFSLDITI
jgi:flagellar hook-length control protein FliK